MDRTAARAANLLVGNDDGEAVIEMHYPAAELAFEDEMAFAIAGQVCEDVVRIGDVANVATSFPGFDRLARAAGFGLRDA